MSNVKPTLKDIVNYANTMVDKETGLAYDTSDVAPSAVKGDLGFEPLNKYDEGLKRGMVQEDVRAFNQPNYKAIGNSLVQLVTGTIGDLVGSPGYAYEGLKGLASDNDTFDNWFIQAGEWIKGLDDEAFPVYMDQDSRNTVFNPFDGEWVANTIEQFGPTLAMMGASFLSEGLLYPALANKLSKIPTIGKYIGAAENFMQSNNIAKTARMAFTSRGIEGGMEAVETYNSTLQELKQSHPELSEEDLKKKAGEAASRVYAHNWMLAAADFLEYKGILSGFGFLGKTGSFMKGLGTLGLEAGSEALEEGLQYAISQEAKAEVMGRSDSTVVSEFIKGLGDTEMQQAMVQGALGGAVFTAAGKIMNKTVENYRKSKQASPAGRQIILGNATLELIKRTANEGKLDLAIADIQKDVEDETKSPEERQHAQKILDKINYYKELAESVEESDLTVKQAKIDSLFKQKYLTDNLAENATINLTPEQTKAELEYKKKQTKNEELKKEYDRQLSELPEDIKAAKLDSIAKKKVKEQVKLEESIKQEEAKEAQLNTKEGKEELLKQREKEIQNQKLDKVKAEIDIYKDPQDFITGLEKYKNDSNTTSLIKQELDNRVKQELDNIPLPNFNSNQEVIDFYSNKPFAAFKKFGTTDLSNITSSSGDLNIGDTFVYTDSSGIPQNVKLVGETSGMYKFITDAGKTLRKSKKYVKSNINKAFVPANLEISESTNKPKDTIAPEDLKEDKLPEEIIAEQVENTNRVDSNTDDLIISEEETEENTEDAPSKSDPSFAKVIDTALFRYDDNKKIIYITNHYGGEMPLDKAREQYTIPKNLKHNEYYVLKDKDGFPIQSGYLESLGADYDVSVIRNLHRYQDLPVFVEIDNNLDYNKGKDYSKIRMDLVIYPNGKRKQIGMLSADSNDRLQEIRKKIFDTNDGDGIFQYINTTSIDGITGGKYNNHSDKSKRQAPSSVIPEDMPLIIGVGYTIGDDQSAATVKFNFDDVAINNEIAQYIDSLEGGKFRNVNHVGKHIYIMSQDPSGKLVPVRVYTKSVKDMPQLKQELLQAINRFDADTARDIIKFNYINSKGEKKSTPDFDSNLANVYGNVKFVDNSGAILKDSEGNSHIDKYLLDGAIVAFKNQDRTYSKIFRYENNQYTELNNDLEVVGNPVDSIKEFGEIKDLYLHYAWNYYRFYEMDNRPLQIDHTQVNTGNYNTEIANERLLSDLIPGSNFNSPTFSIDLNKLESSVEREVENYQPNLTALIEEELANREKTKSADIFGDLTDEELLDIYKSESNNKSEVELSGALEEEVAEFQELNGILKISDTKRINNGVAEYKKGRAWVAYKDQNSTTAQKILNQTNAEDLTPLKTEETSIEEDKSANNVDEIPESNSMDVDDLLGFYGVSEDDVKHRSVLLYKSYNVWDRMVEQTWFQETFPNIPLKVYNALTYIRQFGVNSWGTFTNAGVSILNSANEGTLYHEAWHAVEELYLTDSQLESIKKESIKRFPSPQKADLDNLRELYPNISQEELTDLYYEEKRADAFMDYKLSRDLELKQTGFLNKLGSKLKRFFRELYDFLKFTISNKTTLDRLFWQIDKKEFTNKTFIRNVSKFKPKYRRSTNFTPTEYNEVVNIVASLLDTAINRHLESNPKKSIKQIINESVIPKNGQTVDNLSDNLFVSRKLPYSVINTVLKQYVTISNKEEAKVDFNRLFDALVSIDKQGNVKFKKLTYDILRNLSTRGIVINVSNTQVTEESIGQPIEETEYFDENEDAREGWQAKFGSTSAYEKLGQRVRFVFNNIPVLNWTNKEEGKYKEVTGFLGFTKTYSSNYAYNQLQPIIGNATSKQDMLDKINESDNIIATYVKDNLLSDEKFIGELFIGVGQKNHPIFTSLLQDESKGKYFSKAVSSNSNTLVNKITENIIASFVSFTPIYNNDGTINEDKAKELKSDFDNVKELATKDYNKNRNISDATISILYDTLSKYNLNVPLNILQEAKTNKRFAKSLAGKSGGIYTFVDAYNSNKDPLETNNSGVRDFVKTFVRYYPNDVQNAHKNPTGGQVYEWIDANHLGRTIFQLKKDNNLIDFYQNDIYYRHSPLLNLIKNSHNRNVKPNEYGIDPNKIDYVIYSEIKLDGYNQAKEYSNMSERELYLSILMGYFNSNNHDGTAIFPLPVHSDSPTMTGIKLPIIKNINRSKNKKGILNYLEDAAYQEFIRVKLNRNSIKNQDKYENKFIFFNAITDAQTKELLTLDFNKQEDQDRIREILSDVVLKQYTDAYNKEIARLKQLNIISNDESGRLVFNDNLMNNVPADNFLEHFVGNYMLHQNQFTTIFNGDLSFYKDIGDFYKRAKQIWSPGIYLDTSQTRPTYNVKYEKTNMIAKDDPFSSYEDIKVALYKLYDEKEAERLAAYYESVDETDAQSYIDLYRYKEQQQGLHRWNEIKEDAYQRLMSGEYNMADLDAIFNVNKPFYFGKHLVDNQIIPVQNKNSEFIILPAFAKKSNPLYNAEYARILTEMGYEFDTDGNVTTTASDIERKRNIPDNTLIDQIAFDTAIKVGYYEGVHKYNNSDWRLQMETPEHHLDSDVIFATQVRKHMLNDLDMNETYTLPNGVELTAEQWLRGYNQIIIDDINKSFEEVSKRFDNFEQLIDTLREEVISRDLGDQYLQALDYFVNDIGELETKLPLWHPLHLYRVEALLNSLFTKKVNTQKLENGVTLANLSSYGFKKKPAVKFKEDGSLDYMEAYVPAYNSKFFELANEDGVINTQDVVDNYGEEALRGIVWRIPNEDKYSTFNIKIIGFLPKESGGAIVLPPEVTQIAGLD